MSQHHLGDSDRTAPSDVIIDPDFELAFISHVFHGCEEHAHLFDVCLQEWLEVASIAEPDQTPESLLEVILEDLNLLLDAFLALFVNIQSIIQEEDRQMVDLFDLDFVGLEELNQRREHSYRG